MKTKTRNKSAFYQEFGSAMTEFVIILPFFIILFSGVIKLGQILVESNMVNQNVYEIARRAAIIPASSAELELNSFARNLSAHWGKFIEYGQDDLVVSFDYENNDPNNIPLRTNIRYNAPLKKIISGALFGMSDRTSAKISSPFLLRAPKLGVGLDIPENPDIFTCCSESLNGVTNYCSPTFDLTNPYCSP